MLLDGEENGRIKRRNHRKLKKELNEKIVRLDIEQPVRFIGKKITYLFNSQFAILVSPAADQVIAFFFGERRVKLT